jgi:hypothetical protein
LYGSQKSTLSVEERQTGLSYTVTQPAAAPAAPAAGANAAAIEAYEAAVAVAAAAAPVSTEWEITNVDININDLYLQVNLYLRLYVQNFYNYINNV